MLFSQCKSIVLWNFNFFNYTLEFWQNILKSLNWIWSKEDRIQTNKVWIQIKKDRIQTNKVRIQTNKDWIQPNKVRILRTNKVWILRTNKVRICNLVNNMQLQESWPNFLNIFCFVNLLLTEFVKPVFFYINELNRIMGGLLDPHPKRTLCGSRFWIRI